MRLIDLVNRSPAPEPWSEGENIPWHEPGFSGRMLKEHLDATHDAASRRPALIDEQVRWIHEELLAGQTGRILDLGCGPGLYAVRMAKLGHDVTGIDISPASLEYARGFAQAEGVDCRFVSGDFREASFTGKYDLIMQIHGELNVFRREDAKALIARCADSLAPGDRLLLEVDRPEATREIGRSPSTWRALEHGLFSDEPHLYLEESYWNKERRAATRRYWIVDAASGEVTRHAQSFAAYEADEYTQILTAAGLHGAELIPGYPAAAGRRWMLTGTKAD